MFTSRGSIEIRGRTITWAPERRADGLRTGRIKPDIDFEDVQALRAFIKTQKDGMAIFARSPKAGGFDFGPQLDVFPPDTPLSDVIQAVINLLVFTEE